MRWVLLYVAGGALISGHLIAGCTGDDPTTPTTSTSDAGDAATLSANGTACNAGAECTSGHCNDGVCCDATCDGLCEKCNLPGTVGRCMPVPDGQDPDN